MEGLDSIAIRRKRKNVRNAKGVDLAIHSSHT
jgi:hypothetical protein